MATYYRVCLLIPLLVAVLGYAGSSIPVLEYFAVFTFFMIIAAIPYIAFVVCAFVWSLRQSGNVNKEIVHRKAFLLSPLVFGAVCFCYYTIRFSITPNGIENVLRALTVGALYFFYAVFISGVFSWSALMCWNIYQRFRKETAES